ncbi:MAG: hypothetical protein AAF655_02195 [Bacteroidota bacterium]
MKRKLSLKAAQFPLSASLEKLYLSSSKPKNSTNVEDESVGRFSDSAEAPRTVNPLKNTTFQFFQVREYTSPIID